MPEHWAGRSQALMHLLHDDKFGERLRALSVLSGETQDPQPSPPTAFAGQNLSAVKLGVVPNAQTRTTLRPWPKIVLVLVSSKKSWMLVNGV